MIQTRKLVQGDWCTNLLHKAKCKEIRWCLSVWWEGESSSGEYNNNGRGDSSILNSNKEGGTKARKILEKKPNPKGGG